MLHDQFSPESLMPFLFFNQAANKWLPFLLIILLPIWKEVYKRLLEMQFTYFKTRYILKATFNFRNGEFQISDCSDSFKAVMYDITTKLTQSKHWKYLVYDTTFDSFKMVEFAKPFPVTDTITVTLDKVVENIEKREHNYKVERFTLSLFPRHNDMQSIKSYIEQAKINYEAYSTAKALKTQKIFILNEFHREEFSFPHFTKLNFESNKTFDNLFFEGKDTLLKKLDFFLQNKATYNTLGIPYTMGMLFHGEPGTGKTSTIKAIANYTNRHVIILSTKYIKTYNQLKECLVSEFINDYRIPYDKRIYVIEEIDCSSWGSIVCKRGEGNPPPAPVTPTQEEWTKILEGETDTTNSSGATAQGAAGAAISLLKKNELSITLSDLLELLDGIVEMPGRMIIFTTNHPDKLDPALLRPGRIDINMCFKKLNRHDVARLYHLWFKEELDPAKLTDYQYTQAELGELFSFHGAEAKNKILC